MDFFIILFIGDISAFLFMMIIFWVSIFILKKIKWLEDMDKIKYDDEIL